MAAQPCVHRTSCKILEAEVKDSIEATLGGKRQTVEKLKIQSTITSTSRSTSSTVYNVLVRWYDKRDVPGLVGSLSGNS